MTIYIINYASMWIYFLLYSTIKNKKVENAILIIVAIQLVLLCGSRNYTVGNDTINYLNRFENAADNNLLTFITLPNNPSYLFSAITYAIYHISGSFQLLVYLAAIIAIVPVVIYSNKKSSNPILSIILYTSFNFYLYTFITMKQSAAYGLVLLSFTYIEKRKFLPFAILLIMAAGFHTSAIVFLLAYPAYNLFLKAEKILWLTPVLIALIVFRGNIIVFVSQYIFKGTPISDTGAFTYMAFFIILTSLGFLVGEKRFRADKKTYVLNYMLIGTVLLISTTVISNGIRTAYFYLIFIIDFLPYCIKALYNKQTAFVLKLAVYGMCIFLFFFFLQGFSQQSMTYIPFWQG